MKQRSRLRTDEHTGEISFHSLVKDCAAEPQLIASFNRAYDARLQTPITALLDDRWPNHVSEEEEIQIGYFILFIHEHIWQRLKRARHRMAQGRTGRSRVGALHTEQAHAERTPTVTARTERPIDSPSRKH